jgi:hypothetical protein
MKYRCKLVVACAADSVELPHSHSASLHSATQRADEKAPASAGNGGAGQYHAAVAAFTLSPDSRVAAAAAAATVAKAQAQVQETPAGRSEDGTERPCAPDGAALCAAR